MPHAASRRYAALIAVAFGLSLVATAAQAFTFEDQEGNPSGGMNFYDANKRPPAIGPGGVNFGQGGNVQQGNTHIDFNRMQSFDQKYNPSNLFNPYAREGQP